MSGEGSAARGRDLLRQRTALVPGLLAELPERLPQVEALRGRLPRQLVATGIGTSEGHARHLAECAMRQLGQPARFVSTGALARSTPPGASEDWLVVFSQGLSANARHALQDVAAWGAVIVVTGLAWNEPDALESSGGALKAEWVAALQAQGVVFVDLGAGTEYGALLRVVGARAGYAVAWSLLRSLAALRLEPASGLEIERERIRQAQMQAGTAVAEAFPAAQPVMPFFAADRPLVLVAEGGALEWIEQLALKLTEGLLRPRPPWVDVLNYAHGPLQALADGDASVLYFQGDDDASEGEEAWLPRFRAALDPRHDLRVLRATLPWPFAAVELEAMLDAVILRALEETGIDLVSWPGADREAVLYEVGPKAPPFPAEGARGPIRAVGSASRVRALRSSGWERQTWPELAEAIAAGRRTALIGLGSVEQHGPHLPLGTDRWIAEALLAGLEARLEDAIALPSIQTGCASEHLDFAGTLHVQPETLEALLVDWLGSAAHHGFERAYLFTAHGGNLDALAEMNDRLTARVMPLELVIGTDARIGAMQSRMVEEASLGPLTAGPHAGEYETSVVAHLRPGSVRSEALVPGRLVTPGEAQALFYPSLRPNAAGGVLGDPSAASAARGARYLDAWIDLLEAGYRAAFPVREAGTSGQGVAGAE